MSADNSTLDYDRAPYYVRIVKFICDKCGRKWSSASGNMEDYQICKNCYYECYPVNYKLEAPNKRGNQNRETYEGHKSELCGKCIRLGYSCMEIGQGTGLAVFNDEGQELTLREGDLASFMYTDNTPSLKKPATKMIKNEEVDITKQVEEFPPLTNIHIGYKNEKGKASSSSDTSNSIYKDLHSNSNTSFSSYVNYVENDQDGDTGYEEDDCSEGNLYEEDNEDDENVIYGVYEYNDYLLNNHFALALSLYDEDNEDEPRLDGDNSCVDYLIEGDSLIEGFVYYNERVNEDLPTEEWTYDEWIRQDNEDEDNDE